MPTFEELAEQKQERIHAALRPVVGQTALLVVDMQRSFMDPKASLSVPTSWEILPVVKQMVAFCRSIHLPVIFTEFVASPQVQHLCIDPFGPECLTPEPGQPTGWGLPSGNSHLGMMGPECPDTIEELKPRSNELVVRSFNYDKFHETQLDFILRGWGVQYLIFTGMMADICLGDTLKSAFARNYRITAVTDAITTIWPDILNAMFDIWRRKYARLVTSQEVITELQAQMT